MAQWIKALVRSSDIPKECEFNTWWRHWRTFRGKLTGNNITEIHWSMARGTRPVCPVERNKGLSSTFQPPEEGQSIQRLKHCDKYGNQIQQEALREYQVSLATHNSVLWFVNFTNSPKASKTYASCYQNVTKLYDSPKYFLEKLPRLTVNRTRLVHFIIWYFSLSLSLYACLFSLYLNYLELVARLNQKFFQVRAFKWHCKNKLLQCTIFATSC